MYLNRENISCLDASFYLYIEELCGKLKIYFSLRRFLEWVI